MSTDLERVQEFPFRPAQGLVVDPALAGLRAEQPVLRVRLAYGGDAWLVTRHADAKTVFADPRFSRAAAVGDDVPRTIAVGTTVLLSLDPPEHSRLRRLVAKAFTMRRVESLRPRTQQIVDDLLDTMTAGGPPADISESLCWLLPITVICELLGVPFADRDRFRNWTNHFLVLTGDPADTVEARDRLKDYFAGLIAHRRVEPTNDLLGELVQVRDNDDRLSERELLNLGVGLLFAGHETTANQIGNFLYTLLTNRGYWDELVADAGLVPAAVEELSRIIPLGASAGFTRIATEDLELGGQRIKAGEAVVVETASANRDTEVFDHPDDIDFHRAENPHLAFGHGPHHCLGAQLARMEMQTAIATLVRRLPNLRLAVAAEDVPWRTDRLIRGPIRLPVTW